MGLFTKLFGGAEGCREAMKESYEQHVRVARQSGSDSPHHVGLFGALGSRYKARGQPVTEVELWGDVSPFLAMKEAVAAEALAEYAVFQERPADARQAWLKHEINNALRNPSSSTYAAIAAGGIMNRVAWCRLLESQTIDAIHAAVEKHKD